MHLVGYLYEDYHDIPLYATEKHCLNFRVVPQNSIKGHMTC
jgi:hypothetical protein